MKNILVTGGAGFIGSHLCERLHKEGNNVVSLDNYFTGTKENHIEGVDYINGHTKDIEKIIKNIPDVVFHLGEYARVEKSLEEPEIVWDLNKSGTFAVLEFCRKNKIKIVYAGSSTKFGDGGLTRDTSPYAWTKASNTELVRNYGSWYGLPYAITYFYNAYGPREREGSYGTVVEIFKQKMNRGEKLTVSSPGTQKRNFTHVMDIVEGLVLVGENGLGDDFGLGADKSYTVLELAEMFGGEVEMTPERPGNRMDSEVNTKKAKDLGWEPKRDLYSYIKSLNL